MLMILVSRAAWRWEAEVRLRCDHYLRYEVDDAARRLSTFRLLKRTQRLIGEADLLGGTPGRGWKLPSLSFFVPFVLLKRAAVLIYAIGGILR